LVDTLNGDDLISGSSNTGQFAAIYNDSNGTIITNNGNDIISGSGGYTSIDNLGKIDMGNGNDLISVSTSVYSHTTRSIDNQSSGVIDMGNGNDRIEVNNTSSEYGMHNDGSISMGNGNDLISAFSKTYGIYNNSLIDTGRGNDILQGKTGDIYGNSQGITNYDNGAINMGSGDDLLMASDCTVGLWNTGNVSTGEGNDSIDVSGAFFGVYNAGNIGTIDMGSGNDSLIAAGNAVEVGIISGTITMSEGDDRVETSDLVGDAYVDLGIGNDRLQLTKEPSQGSGKANGGSGFDILELAGQKANYGISRTAGINGVSFSMNGSTLSTEQFESFVIGGTSYTYDGLFVA
jgi:hypothetical protein